jgi:hypothetical protein
MRKPQKDFDALRFKEEMQRRAGKKLSGNSAEDRLRCLRKRARRGPLGKWWGELPKGAMPRRRVLV